MEENLSENLEPFITPVITGYKQGILGDNEKALWTPFLIMGKGVKQGVQLSTPIRHIDQLPTILKLMGIAIPSYVEGKPINKIFK